MNSMCHAGQWRLSITVAAVGSGLLVVACSAPPEAPKVDPTVATAAAAPPVTVNTSYNELMVAWIDNASHVLWDAEKPGFAPKDDADWTEIEDHAIQVSAAGSLLLLPGTGATDAVWASQDAWKTNARLMADAGGSALAAARRRDLSALVAANSTLVQSCENCHKQFKSDLPTEGIAHQRPHSESHKTN